MLDIFPKYKIISIDSEHSKHRIGRIIQFIYFGTVGASCEWENLEKGNYTRTSPVVFIEESEDRIIMQTINTKYEFEEIK